MSQLRSRQRLLAAVWGALLLLIASGILAGMAGAQSEGQIGEGGEGAYPTAAIPPEIAPRQEIPPTPWQSFEGISGEEGGQREETPTPAPPVFISTTEPASIINDRQQVLSVLGGNFSAGTVIRLVGWGFLPTTFVNTGAITATLPQGIPPGTYPIEVIDPVGGSATAPGLLIVSAPFISPTPTNTLTPMPTITPTFTPTGTPLPPTPMPGEPSLIVRNFIPVPTEVAPGGNVSLGFEVVNLGNRIAQGVSVSLDPGGKFVPAPGQSSATLPDIPPGGVGGVALLVAAFGVANTMTMAILERTREIGLMKAIGARDRDILTVFLCEAGLVGLLGGAAGLGVSYLVGSAINSAIASMPVDPNGGSPLGFLGVNPAQLGGGLVVIPSDLALFALALAMSVGIIAGLLPSLRAARMLTVQALRSE